MIQLRGFKGIIPKLNADKLPDRHAQVSVNCRFSTGELSGVGSTSASTFSGGALFPYSKNDGSVAVYSVADAEADFARSPVRSDDHQRIYWTSSAGFRFARVADNAGATLSTSYKVGVAVFDPANCQLNGAKTKAGVVVGDSAAAAVCAGGLTKRPSAISRFAPAVEFITLKVLLQDAYGATIRDVTGDRTVLFAQVPGENFRGWARQFTFSMPKTADGYANTNPASSSTGLQYFAFSGNIIEASLYGVQMGGWALKNASGGWDFKYFKILDGTQYPLPDGGLVSITAVENGRTEYAVFKGNGGFSSDGSALPSLSVPSVSGTEEGLRYAVELVMRLDGVDYTNTVAEGQGEVTLSGTNNAVRWSLSKGGSTGGVQYYINFAFGQPLGVESRSYIFTFVNNLGEESGPFGPFDVSLDPGIEDVEMYFLNSWVSSIGVADRYPLHGIRVYSSMGYGEPGKDFGYKFCLKLPTATGTIPGETYLATSTVDASFVALDTTLTTNGDACPTVGFITNTDELQSLRGLTTLYNGILGAFKGNELWLSEPYMPWAWRRRNVHSLPHKIVALLPQEQGVYVLTDGHPYYASGATPEDMVPTKLLGQFPCVSKRSAAVVNGKAVYVSPDGPVILNGVDAQLDAGVFGRETWRTKVADYVASGGVVGAAAYSDRLLLYFSPSMGTTRGYLYDLTSGDVTEYTGAEVRGAVTMPAGVIGAADNLLIKTATDWRVFGTGSPLGWVYQSKDFILQRPTNYGAAQLFGDGTLLLQVYADGVLRHSVSVQLSRAGSVVRLPSGFRAARWSFAFSSVGVTTLSECVVAVSVRELRNV